MRLSNQDFLEIVRDKSPRIVALAKARVQKDPDGFMALGELDNAINVCLYTGDKEGTAWLQSLRKLLTSGKLAELYTGTNKYENHRLEVTGLYKKGEIAFDIGDHIMLKDTGKRGTVVDYIPDTKEFLVALQPYQLMKYEKKDLERVAKKAQYTGGYLVGVGGAPRDQKDHYDNLEDAKEACLDMARRQAIREGIDPDDVSLYHESSEGDDGWGASPEGDSGAYWPVVTAVGGLFDRY